MAAPPRPPPDYSANWEGPQAARQQRERLERRPQRPATNYMLQSEGPETARAHRLWLEGAPRAADRKRPHIAHDLSGGAPLRKALEQRRRLEGKPHVLIRREGIGPALISTNVKRK